MAWIERRAKDHEQDKSRLNELREERFMLLNGGNGDHRIPQDEIPELFQDNERQRKVIEKALEAKIKPLEEKYKERCKDRARLECFLANREHVEKRSGLYLNLYRSLIEQFWGLDQNMHLLDEQ